MHLPQLEDDVHADLCVIGLGGSGLACAREAARLGASVVGIDAAEVAGQAAGRNGGFLLAGLSSFYHMSVERFGHVRARTAYELTRAEIDRMEQETPDSIRRAGSLRIADSPQEELDCETQLTAMRTHGFAAESYHGAEGRGLLIPGDAAFDPVRRCHALANALVGSGVRLFENSPMLSTGNGVTRTPNGSVYSRYCVVTIDGNLEHVIPELANDVRTARLQMLATAPTSEVVLSRPVYARWGYDYWQQLPDGCIALGGARDIGGDAEWTSERGTTEPVQNALEARLRNDIGIAAPVTHRWSAGVAYSMNGLPVVRMLRENTWVIGAYSGTGNVLGSLLGRGLARKLFAVDDRLLVPFFA